MIAASLAFVLLLQSQFVPSSGNVLVTPSPSASLNPLFAEHPSSADLRLGKQLFNVHCTSCHGSNLQGTAQGPPLINVDAQYVDFMLRTGRMPAAVPFEQEFDKPSIFSRPQMSAIVDYVMSKSTGNKALPGVSVRPDSPFNSEALKRGREVYAENCQQCHAATAHGDSVGYQDVAPELMDSSPEQIAEAVRVGPDVMPKFGPKIISESDLDDLISYVGYLQRGKYNPGGMQAGKLGPGFRGVHRLGRRHRPAGAHRSPHRNNRVIAVRSG